MAKDWKLRISHRGKMVRDVALVDACVVVGRALDCDIVLDDERVSKRHFEILADGSDLLLTDLGSRNGTRVNGRIQSDVQLRDGDVIELGRSRLEVMRESLRSGRRDPERYEIVEEDEDDGGNALGRPLPGRRSLQGSSVGQRVEVISKSSAGEIALVGQPDSGKRLKLMLGGLGVLVLLLLLTISFSDSSRRIHEMDNPLDGVHEQDDAGQADLFTETRAEEAGQLRARILSEVQGLMVKYGSAELAVLPEEALEPARAALKKMIARIRRSMPSTGGDPELLALVDRLKSALGKVDSRADQLKQQHAFRVKRGLARAQSLVDARRYEEAGKELQKVLQMEPGDATATKLLRDVERRRAGDRLRSRRQKKIRELSRGIEVAYRTGLEAQELGNSSRAMREWGQAEEFLQRLRTTPGARGSTALARAEELGKEIRRRRSSVKPKQSVEEENAKRLLGKARFYEDLGKLDKARNYWKRVMEMIPNPAHRYHKIAAEKLKKTE